MKYCISCGQAATHGERDVPHAQSCCAALVVRIVKYPTPTPLLATADSCVHIRGTVTPPPYPPELQEPPMPYNIVCDYNYPHEEFLAWLRATPNHALAIGLAGDYCQSCGYGQYVIDGCRRTLITGGWSGCEDVIDALRGNFRLWVTCWAEHHRGGKWVFELPPKAVEEHDL